MITQRPIDAGGEIFVNYGEQWFLDREEDVGAVPFEYHFHNIDIFLTTFKRMSLMYQTADNPDFTRDLWDVVMSQAIYDTRSGNALPLTFEDMQLAHGIGAAESRRRHSIRTKEWLRKHGRCMDNIRPGISTIPQAGRGAFASRFIPLGGLVAPGPVLHMANRTSLNVYDETENGSRDKSKHVSMQLLLNYCFGNKRSTVLLCPYTSPSAYINHSSERANVKVVWATNTTPNHNPGWLEEDVDFLKSTEKGGLSLDFIATRDIEPGEEGTLNVSFFAAGCPSISFLCSRHLPFLTFFIIPLFYTTTTQYFSITDPNGKPHGINMSRNGHHFQIPTSTCRRP